MREGFVTIQGEVTWHYPRSAVDNCMRNLRGVTGVSNVLSGTARNYTERESAEWAAYSAPGVANVDNNIRVEW